MVKKPLLIYCALPSRIRNLTQDTYDFVKAQGHMPLHPFMTFPEKDFSDTGTFGRENAMRGALKLVSASDRLYLFGISEGTIDEARQAHVEGKIVMSFIEEFDGEWRKYDAQLKRLRGNDYMDFMDQKKFILNLINQK